jgi:hypothetical protein
MKTIARVGVWGCCWVAGLAVSVQGAEFVLKPIRASGTYTIVGNEIRLNGAGQRVFLEVQMQGWAPAFLRTYQAKLDAVGGDPGMGYDNLIGASLAPAVQTCTTNAQCVTAFAAGARCNVPVTGGGFKCETGFIDKNRATPTPFVFPVDEVDQSGVATGSLNYAYFAIRTVTSPPGEVDPGALRYGGDLVLDVPAGATGTYTINFNPEPTVTLMADPDNNPLSLNPPTAAKITILCSTNANCNDNNSCTNDVCNPNGTCSNTNNYNPVTQCCNRTTGALQVLSDGDPCTDDVCDIVTGQVTHPPAEADTPCGNPANSQCDRPDSCDGAGNCLARLEPNGMACGNSTNTECNGADTCDGAGVCLTNIRDNTTPCGDPSSGPCDDPDKCNGLGACLTNNKPNGVPCSTGQFCTKDERCQDAVCTNGTPTNCADLLTCTTDSCNEGANQCDHPLDAGKCLIDDVCYLPGDLRPGNTCEECNPSLSTTAWSVKPDGSACNDGNACTGTGRPGIDDDTCTSGVCAGEIDPQCNDQCDFAVPAIVGVNLSNNSSAGPDDGEASCQPLSNNDVWFKYTAACNGITFASTTGSALAPSNDTVLSVYTDCPALGGTEIACDDDSGVGLQSALNFSTTNGTTYLIRVAGFEDNKGPIHLNLRPVDDCLIDGVCYGAYDLNPSNDCQACIPDVSTTQWSPRAEGSACGNILDTECDSPDACDGAGVCEVNWKPDGILCSDEVPADVCTKNLCGSGLCTHPPEPAGLACGDPSDTDCDNPDTCDGGGGCADNLEGAGHACGDQTDTQCDNPNICDAFGGCLDNLEIDGVACDDGDICTGADVCATGVCVGFPAIEPPIVEGIGSRYLLVTPQDAFVAAPVALHVTSPNWPCLDKYIDASGHLVPPADKVFKLPSEWGAILVQDPDIVPSTTYYVEAECGAYQSAPGIGSTWLWGDMDNSGIVDAIDIALLVNKFKELPGSISTEIADIHPCVPNGIINALDITIVVMIVKGQTYYCGPPCH